MNCMNRIADKSGDSVSGTQAQSSYNILNILFILSKLLTWTLHEYRAMPARRAVMWRLCRHKRGRPRSFCRTSGSTKRHVLRHRAWDRLVLCRSRLLQESSPTRAISGLTCPVWSAATWRSYFPARITALHRLSLLPPTPWAISSVFRV